MPGYDVATLVEKSGKSPAHVYARLSLLQLVPTIADAFTAERITASHANLLARLPQDAQANAYEQCWRKDWQDKEPHLLPAKHLSAWIQTNLYLSLADAPFSKEDPTLNPTAGACVTCPRRSGFNSVLFADVESHGDQCLDAPCFHTKVNAHLDREIAARPELVQIEDAWRKPTEKRPEAVQRGHFREIDTTNQNPDAVPVPACEAAKPAIVVYGKRVGTILTVCIDNQCPVHDPRAAATSGRTGSREPARPLSPPHPRRKPRNRLSNAASSTRQNARPIRKSRTAAPKNAASRRSAKSRNVRQSLPGAMSFASSGRRPSSRSSHRPPATLSPAQLRVILRAIVNLDPYTFADDLATDISEDPDNDRRSAEEVLLTVIDGTADDKLTSFAVRLALAGHRGIPRENEPDFLTEAAAAFLTPKPKKNPAKKTALAKVKEPTPIKLHKAAAKKAGTKRNQPQPDENAVAA